MPGVGLGYKSLELRSSRSQPAARWAPRQLDRAHSSRFSSHASQAVGLLPSQTSFYSFCRGGTRTHKSKRTKDFQSYAYAVPPPGLNFLSPRNFLSFRLIMRNYFFTKNYPFTCKFFYCQLIIFLL